ncbi:recombinase family protein [Streptomyces sp. NPDC057555]|uniref:recombinase family protein n=1 Tax=Streptomyces sp. NPDC057555 TaxID=3346166 RepID=UPI0036CE5A06
MDSSNGSADILAKHLKASGVAVGWTDVAAYGYEVGQYDAPALGADGPPLAFVYDRSASHSRRQLGMRLEGCRHYADRMGWVVVGGWFDLGEHAMSIQRPQLDALITTMRAQADECEVLCLVHTWERLTANPSHRLLLQQRITAAGGQTVTTFDAPGRTAARIAATRRNP